MLEVAHASDLKIVQVAQPIHDPNEGTQAFRLTYAESFESWPGYAISLTCAPNLVPVMNHDPVNMNAANLLGFKVQVEDRADPTTWKRKTTGGATPGGLNYFVDTIGVTLDLRNATKPELRRDELDSADKSKVVEVTIECILENARESLPPIEHVRLTVLGDSALVRRSGVYRVGSPRPRQW
jgi:hypothetical protein